MTVRIDIVSPATSAQLDELVAHLRPECLEDLKATGWGDLAALREACAKTRMVAVVLDGAVAAMAGTRGKSVWVLATPVAAAHPEAFKAASRAALPLVLGEEDAVSNYVPATFKAAVRWLQWLGCHVGPAEARSSDGRQYHHVTLRRQEGC